MQEGQNAGTQVGTWDVHLSNPNITREMVDEAAERLAVVDEQGDTDD